MVWRSRQHAQDGGLAFGSCDRWRQRFGLRLGRVACEPSANGVDAWSPRYSLTYSTSEPSANGVNPEKHFPTHPASTMKRGTFLRESCALRLVRMKSSPRGIGRLCSSWHATPLRESGSWARAVFACHDFKYFSPDAGNTHDVRTNSRGPRKSLRKS